MNTARAMADAPGTRSEVNRLFACSMTEGMLSIGLAVLVAAAAWFTQRHGWLGLFGAILLPIAAGSLCLRAGAFLAGERLRWNAAWLLLLVALAGGACLALGLYQRWMAAFALPAMADLKLLVAAFGVGALALGLPLWHAQVQDGARRLAWLRQAALASELKALQAQVEPHFLYNTLANTRYLTRHDPDKAVQMLDHLIAYLHSALPDLRTVHSTLGREFELAGHYLALMAIRFGERLDFRLDCPPALAATPMPPLMLMTLVENAVRHGLEPQPGPVRIRLGAAMHDGRLRITVADDGAGPGATAMGSGVGLRNLRQRLAALYGDAASFGLSRSAAGVTEALLALPLTQKKGMWTGNEDE